MSFFGRWLYGAACLGLLAGSGVEASGAAAETNHFGFRGPEIFPIDPLISNLNVADLDGDGLNDLVVVNNSRSRINLLYNQTGKPPQADRRGLLARSAANELPADARFRIESIASEKRISALVVADLNGDGRPDIAYYGEPRELVVLYNLGTNGWSAPKRWPLDDGQLSANALTTGDLHGEGRTDLILLADSCVYCLPQRADHTLGEPEKIPYSGNIKGVQVLDIDGDGRKDLLLVNWENRNPFRVRFQQARGQLGPELYFSSVPLRSYWADNLEPKGKTEVISIAMNSGRAGISEFVRKPAEPLSGEFHQGQLQVSPLMRTDKTRRGMLWADVNGDGLADLLVAEPESGQISISLRQADGSLGPARKFPTLAGVTDLAVADWDGDGKPEIFLLSDDERQVGVTRLNDKQGLAFPTLIPLEGKPLVMAVGRLQPAAKPVLAVIVDQDGRRSLVLRQAEGKSRAQKLSEAFKSNPASMVFADADQDGLADLVVLTPYEKVKVMRQRPDNKEFEELDVAAPGGAMEQPWVSAVDLDGDGKPELLFPQKNFVRGVVLRPDSAAAASTNQVNWTFQVKEQINGAGSNSRLVDAMPVLNGTNAIASLFLLDAERKALTLCERDPAGVWQVVRSIDLPYSEFSGLQPLALKGGRVNAIGLVGLNAAGCLPLWGETWELTELDGYETPIKDGHLNDVVTGDLDNDGRKDLVFLETARNYLDLVVFDAQHKLVPANRWQVFEERSFRGRRSDLPEPREAAVADVTGDKRNDLIVVVHDRILVYPQE